MESHLLRLAADLLRSSGRVPTLTELAAEAGVSRATAYRAFGNQEGLVARLQAEGVAIPAEGADVHAAVRAVLLASGLDGFSIEAVARRSGLSVPTLHRRFGGREGLLFDFFDHLAPRVEAWRLDEQGPAEEVLATFGARVSAWLHEDARLLLAALGAAPETWRRLARARAAGVGTQEALAGWLERRAEAAAVPLPEPRRAAQAFLGATLGLTAPGPLSPDAARWWAVTFLRGLGIA